MSRSVGVGGLFTSMVVCFATVLLAQGLVAQDAGTAAGLEPVRAQIHGSLDHVRVARALFAAGQALMDSARAADKAGQVELAARLDARAVERLQRAVDELAPVLEGAEPDFQALFQLGRCRELLFRLDERRGGLSLASSPAEYHRREQQVRAPFLAITLRDVRRIGDRSDVEVMGAWGMAAQVAMEHFRWMNVHGSYDARDTIEALTWPGQRPE
jgi:hypothetical protein